jgi:hypothetical protein
MFGAGVAVTGGVNELPPVGLMLFSVGEGGLLDSGVVVVVVDVDGEGVPLLPHPDNAPIATRAAAPTATVTRRPTGVRFMAQGPFDLSAERSAGCRACYILRSARAVSR